MRLGKRPHESKICIQFLLNQRQIVTQHEYYEMMQDLPYAVYLSQFYSLRIPEIFQKYKDEPWFVQRYLRQGNTKEERASTCNKLTAAKYVVLESLEPSADVKMLEKEFIGKYPEICEVLHNQKGPQDGFTRDIYLRMSEDADLDEFIDRIKMENTARKLVIPEIRDSTHFIGTPEAETLSKKILETFYKLPRRKYNDLKLDDMGYERRLNEIFLYCLVCGHQYDCAPAMYEGCISNQHVLNSGSKNMISRNSVLMSQDKVFGVINPFSTEEEVDNRIMILSEGAFKCKNCDEIFHRFNIVKNHILEEHLDAAKVKKDSDNFQSFLESIDCLALEIIEGTNGPEVPAFVLKAPKQKQIVYDLPLWFSGTIRM